MTQLQKKNESKKRPVAGSDSSDVEVAPPPVKRSKTTAPRRGRARSETSSEEEEESEEECASYCFAVRDLHFRNESHRPPKKLSSKAKGKQRAQSSDEEEDELDGEYEQEAPTPAAPPLVIPPRSRASTSHVALDRPVNSPSRLVSAPSPRPNVSPVATIRGRHDGENDIDFYGDLTVTHEPDGRVVFRGSPPSQQSKPASQSSSSQKRKSLEQLPVNPQEQAGEVYEPEDEDDESEGEETQRLRTMLIPARSVSAAPPEQETAYEEEEEEEDSDDDDEIGAETQALRTSMFGKPSPSKSPSKPPTPVKKPASPAKPKRLLRSEINKQAKANEEEGILFSADDLRACYALAQWATIRGLLKSTTLKTFMACSGDLRVLELMTVPREQWTEAQRKMHTVGMWAEVDDETALKGNATDLKALERRKGKANVDWRRIYLERMGAESREHW